RDLRRTQPQRRPTMAPIACVPSRARTRSSFAPTIAASAALCRSVAEHVIIGDPDVFHLSVERGAPDAELARHLRHLPAIMGEREANDLGFDPLQRAHVTAIVDHAERMRIAVVVSNLPETNGSRRISSD